MHGVSSSNVATMWQLNCYDKRPRCVLHGLTVQRRPSESPAKGTSDGPPQHYPTRGVPGKGRDGALLPHRRRLRPPQPAREHVWLAQAALGLGGTDARPPAAVAGRGERAVLPARCREVLRAPLPGRGGAPPFLVAPTREEAAALPGAVAAGGPGGARGRAGDPHRGLDAAFRAASQAGRAVGRVSRSSVGRVGIVRRLRGEAAPPVLDQPRPTLLRTYRRQRRGRAPGARALGGGKP